MDPLDVKIGNKIRLDSKMDTKSETQFLGFPMSLHHPGYSVAGVLKNQGKHLESRGLLGSVCVKVYKASGVSAKKTVNN